MGKSQNNQPILRLCVCEGPCSGLEAAKQSAKFLAGRRKNLGFCISDSTISERHAEFSWSGEVYKLKDLGSSNGTFLNGKAVSSGEFVQLSDQDMVRLGLDTLIRVEINPPPSSMDEKTVEEFLQADVELLKQRILRRGDVICQLLRSEASEALQSMDLNGGDAAG
uniref:Smad fha domain-containing protein n=1 Tax=Tetraselmis sp. GSL018 TaxID=582737 RepID=A0A061R1W1_9CHLO